jgi:capsular polysaccharide biosynthesis protein
MSFACGPCMRRPRPPKSCLVTSLELPTLDPTGRARIESVATRAMSRNDVFADSDLVDHAHGPAEAESPPAYLVGRLVSLRFVVAALRRRRMLLVCGALAGLLVGASYHLVVPRLYEAQATLYLAHVPGTDDDVDMANDLALLQTRAVAERAITLLREPGLNPGTLLGKAPGIALSDNVLSVSIGGPSKAEAIRRVNAVASAFLVLRSEYANQQANATTAALQKQLGLVSAQVNELTAQINSGSISAADRGNLVVERSVEESEIATFQQNIQQAQNNALTVAEESRVLSPGWITSSSTAKLLTLDGLTGLAGGLVVVVGFVTLQALLSNRIRNRDDVAALLGAPVEFSGSIRPPRTRSLRWTEQMVVKPNPDVMALAAFLRGQRDVVHGRSALLVMAADRVETPVAALGVLASALAADGNSVAVVDLTDRQMLSAVIGLIRERAAQLSTGDPAGAVTLVQSPPGAARAEDGADPSEADADVVLALATVHPRYGAWHLNWAREAIVTVTAGRSSAQHVSATAELARVAGVFIAAAALLEADTKDETMGQVPVVSHFADVERLSATWT